MNEPKKDCCKIVLKNYVDFRDGAIAEIEYCPLHRATPKMLQFLQDLDCGKAECGHCQAIRDLVAEATKEKL
jgi:hypothetical protein